MTSWRRKTSPFAVLSREFAASASICLLATTASAGATKDLEQSAVYPNDCSSHFGQLEHDAREAGRDFCANLGGIDQFDPFESNEEIIRENEYSKKFSCTVRTKVECYEDE